MRESLPSCAPGAQQRLRQYPAALDCNEQLVHSLETPTNGAQVSRNQPAHLEIFNQGHSSYRAEQASEDAWPQVCGWQKPGSLGNGHGWCWVALNPATLGTTQAALWNKRRAVGLSGYTLPGDQSAPAWRGLLDLGLGGHRVEIPRTDVDALC